MFVFAENWSLERFGPEVQYRMPKTVLQAQKVVNFEFRSFPVSENFPRAKDYRLYSTPFHSKLRKSPEIRGRRWDHLAMVEAHLGVEKLIRQNAVFGADNFRRNIFTAKF